MHVIQAAGQVRLLVPRDLPVVVEADVHAGMIERDGTEVGSGWNVNRTLRLGPDSATPITIEIDLSAGNISIETG